MPIMDHLGELRRRLTIIVVSLLTVAVIVYFATPTLIDLMIDQIEEAMRGGDLYVLTALGGFTIRFKVAMFFSMIICTPIIIWEIMAFILPALKPKERKWVVPTVAALVALFFIGMIFCYYVIQPAAFGWLLDQSFEFAQNMADAEDYLNIYMLLEIGFGIAFELPLAIFYLDPAHRAVQDLPCPVALHLRRPHGPLGCRHARRLARDHAPHVCRAYRPVRDRPGNCPQRHCGARRQAGSQVVPRGLRERRARQALN